MKISTQWLHSYLDRPVDAGQIARLLTNQGLPIESRSVLAGGDEVLEVEVTSNRPDCLSYVGVAREVAAGVGCAVVAPDDSLPPAENVEASSLAGVAVEDDRLCPLYTARVIRGVKVGPSPAWLVQRLEAVGLRSVNNVADVTNFVLMELGQPLHAFDLATLGGGRVVVRVARDGESIVAIDGSKHALRRGMLVVADAQKPVAIAGVMGGMDTRVTEKTADVLLESAVFSPTCVRQASRALKLASDSSYRFERGVDPIGVELASRRAAKLICELAGGRVAKGVVRVGIDPPRGREVSMRLGRCNDLLGIDLQPQQAGAWLERLGFKPQWRRDGDQQRVVCTVPGHRLDIEREVDLIEEVGRMQGLESVPVGEKIHIVAKRVQPRVSARQELGRVLTAHGYHETVMFSFMDTKHGRMFVPAGEEAVMVEHERRKAEPMLRPSLLPSLLACRKSNQDVGNGHVRLFECAAVWSRRQGAIAEQNRLGLLSDSREPQESLRDVRGTVRELVERLAGDVEVVYIPCGAAHMLGAAHVEAGGSRLGVVGLIDPACQRVFDLQSPVVAAELSLEGLLAGYPPNRAVRQLPRFPAIERDLSVVVKEPVAWADIQQQVLATQPALLEDLLFLGVYRGQPVPKGSKSVSFRMLFRDPGCTLRHDQVDSQVAVVVQRLETQLGAQLRG